MESLAEIPLDNGVPPSVNKSRNESDDDHPPGFPGALQPEEREVRVFMKIAGKVKWFDEKKGWGFIQKDDGSDVCVPTRASRRAGSSPSPTARPWSSKSSRPEGPQAANVTKRRKDRSGPLSALRP